jgi:hypothetical protein
MRVVRRFVGFERNDVLIDERRDAAAKILDPWRN